MKKQRIVSFMLSCVLILATIMQGLSMEQYEAATSYTNARDFYESTYVQSDNAHAEAANGCFYFATYAKKASSSTNLKYRTIGFDVSLSANGYEVAFVTKVGVSMKEVPNSKVDTGTHIYMLYCIDRDFLYEIGSLVNSSAMEKIKKADVIHIKIDAIMTLVKGSNQYGSTRTGYNFKGYFPNMFGNDDPIVDTEGLICVENTYFTKDFRIYGYWVPKEYPVIFDRQGGIYGTESATATYDELFPSADAPVRNGYTFMGYYTEPKGQGECIYNALMTSDKIYTYDNDEGITLYAYWVDDLVPDVILNVSCDTWTKDPVTLTASARDYGSGLSSLQIYVIHADGTTDLVAEENELDGISSKELEYVNPTEGVIRYKAVATDVDGNTAEYYNVVYYDKTAPTGTVTCIEIDGNIFYIELEVSDVNVE